MFRNTEYKREAARRLAYAKKLEAPMKKEYKKPKVTVTKLQIEERLMACAKQPPTQACKKGGRTPKFS